MPTLDLARTDELRDAPAGQAVIVTEAWAGHTTGYVARIEPLHRNASPLYELERMFADPARDRRSRFGNGRREYQLDQSGVYEAESRWHAGKVRRHWFEVGDAGTLELLASRDEAMARLWAVAPHELRQLRLEAWEQRGNRAGWIVRQQAAAAANGRAGFAALEGTAAQVGYAEVLRADWIAQIARRLGGPEFVPWRFLGALRALEQVSDAAWWIARRRGPWRRVLKDAEAIGRNGHGSCNVLRHC